jgi:hypothetical protein
MSVTSAVRFALDKANQYPIIDFEKKRLTGVYASESSSIDEIPGSKTGASLLDRRLTGRGIVHLVSCSVAMTER